MTIAKPTGDNPYQPPQTTGHEVGFDQHRRLAPTEHARLLAIARGQKGVLACVAANLGMRVLLRVTWPADSLEGPPLAVSCAALLVAGLTAVCVGLLAARLYGRIQGLLFGLFALVPGLTLLPLLVVLFKATRTLSRQGVRVGLLGADFGRQPAV